MSNPKPLAIYTEIQFSEKVPLVERTFIVEQFAEMVEEFRKRSFMINRFQSASVECPDTRQSIQIES